MISTSSKVVEIEELKMVKISKNSQVTALISFDK